MAEMVKRRSPQASTGPPIVRHAPTVGVHVDDIPTSEVKAPMTMQALPNPFMLNCASRMMLLVVGRSGGQYHTSFRTAEPTGGDGFARGLVLCRVAVPRRVFTPG